MTIRIERFRYLALAIILSVGAGLIWGVVFAFGFGIVNSIISSHDVREELVFTHDETPIIQSYAGNNYGARTYRTLDGKPVEIAHYDLEHGARLSGPVNRRKRFFNLSWSQRIVDMRDDSYGPEKWYFICDGELHGRGYVVGYDKVAKAKIGYIGRNGFRSDEPPREEQFPVDGRKISRHGIRSLILYGVNMRDFRDTKYLLTDDGLIQINLKKRTVKNVWKETNLISAANLYDMRMVKTTSAKKISFPAILLRMPDRVLVFDPSGKEIQTYLLPAELRNDSLTFIPLKGDKALVHKSFHHHNELLWIDTAGKIVEHRRVDLRERAGLGRTAQSFVGFIGVPSIGVFVGTAVCYPWGAETESLGYWAALSKGLQMLGKGIHIYWPVFLFAGVISVILAVLCYRRQRKYGLPWTWVWTVFVLLFGVPAYLGYLAHRSWPVRLPCASCGRPAPRDREACFSCNHDFPAPKPKGIEVFA